MQGFYNIVTYGCQMNVHESEKLAGVLEEFGYIHTDEITKADVVVFNTCCIRENAEHKAFGNIGALKPIKKTKTNMIIAVCGCMTQQENKADELMKKFPFVNIVFGTHNLYKFKEYLESYKQNKKKVKEIWNKNTVLPEEVNSYRTSGYNAWVNINYGCNKFCSYCIVPYVRGREISRKFEDIIDECKKLIFEGYKTITLLGQNVNAYGKDLMNPNYTFSKLLSAVANLEGNFIVKFMSPHPSDFDEEVIKVIASNKKISRLIHLPLQSGSNKILNLMRRSYTVEKFTDEVNMIRKYMPEAKISTDIIVGFPFETDEDFQETLNITKKLRFSTMFAFIYSKRKGTPAEKMEGQVSLAVKRERINQLLKIQREIEKEETIKNIGTIQRVIMESYENGKIMAKNEVGQKILIKETSEKDFKIDFISVKIINVNKNILIAEKI